MKHVDMVMDHKKGLESVEGSLKQRNKEIAKNGERETER